MKSFACAQTHTPISIIKGVYRILIEMCALFSFHSSVHRPKHTRTCHQSPYLCHPLGFVPQTGLLSCLWIKPRMWPNANETVATWCFLFWGPFLPPIHFREPRLIATSLELGWGFPPLPLCGPPQPASVGYDSHLVAIWGNGRWIPPKRERGEGL